MIDLNNLKVYKGAPITIITALMLLKRNASQKELQEICGYGSDRPVRDALAVLIQDHIVIKAGHGSYMLAAYQLPLSWTETIERLPSEELPYVKSMGDIAESTSLQERIEDHESRIRKLEAILNVRTKYEAIAESAETIAESTKMLPEKEIVQSTETIAESTGIIVQSTTSEEAEVKGLINKYHVKEASKQVIDIDPCLVKDNEGDLLTAESAKSTDSSAEIPEAAQTAWKCAAGQIEDHTLLRGAVLSGYSDSQFTVSLDNAHKIAVANGALRDIMENILSTIMKTQISVVFVSQRISANSTLRKHTLPSRTVPADTQYETPALELLPVPDKLRYPGEEKCIKVANEYLLNPIGIAYSVKEMQELITPTMRGAVVDPDVLRFILPRAANFAAAKKYAGQKREALKYNLISRVFCFRGPMVNQIVKDPNVTPELIDFHYWNIDLDPQFDMAKDKALVMTRILDHENKLHAESCDPQQVMYIEER